MKTIQATHSMVFAQPAMRIWQVLTDLPGYSAWWPSSIKIRPLHVSEKIFGARIEVRPYGGQAFCCEVSGMNIGNELTLVYSGIYSGTGTWTISESNGQSLVTYTIELKIQSIFIRVLSLVLPVATIHARLMEEALAGLGHYLQEIGARAEPDAVADRSRMQEGERSMGRATAGFQGARKRAGCSTLRES